MKSQRIIYILISLLLGHFLSAQNIDKLECFFDNDPGYGNGQNLSVSSAADVVHSSNINTSSLSSGIHTFYYRAKQNGVWSQTHSTLVGVSASNEISQGEYYFDTDPGYGNATPFNVTTGNLVSLNISPDISNLSHGIHTLHIRVFDGAWSSTFTSVIGIYTGTALNGLQTEYFFDTDPGYGNGQSAGNLNSNGVSTLSPDISSLNHGLHTLYFRVKGGSWSQTYSKQLLVIDNPNNPISFEYFFNNDPGMGNATSVNATSITNGVYTLNSNINTNSLSSGVHTFYLRAYNGAYSQTFSRVIGIFGGVSNSDISAEYYFDNDPGYGNGTAMTSATNDGVFQTNISTSSLSNGLHTLFIRSMAGSYSQTYSKEIFVNDNSGITDIEYYIDNDPGYGNGTSLNFTQGNQIVSLNFNPIISSLNRGIHQIGIRAKASNWGQTFIKEFYVSEDENITQAEYFFNTDPGYGNANQLSVTANKAVELNFSPDLSAMNPGYSVLYVRVKNGDGQWSLVHNDSVCISATANFTFDTVCAGNSTSFTNLTTNSNSSTSYIWDIDNDGSSDYTNSGSFQHTYSSSGTYTVKLIAQQTDGCGDTISKQIIVNPNLTPSVSISSSDTNICTGSSVTFTASPVNGGSTPTYIWKKNGSTVGTNSANFTSSSLQNNDVITVEMTSSETCASPTSANSSGITMIVNPLLTPAVSISSTDTTICAGSSVTFTANPVNGGSTPTYVWKKNGSTVGTNSANFTSSSLQNNDVITVEMTSSESCASPTSATSSGITMIVNPLLTPAVSISSTDTTICAGSSVTFTASPINGGSTPTYVWKKNGSSLGTNSANFTSSSLQNNDVITVEMTSSEICASPTSATSSGITMIVNPLLTPSVSIFSTDTTICAGSSVTFTANPVNGGSTPTYVWKKNGSTVGTNSANFTSSSLQNNDVITVEMTSSETCASPTSATSSGITMIVNPLLTPAVSISSTDTTICAGSSVTFTANPVNGGSTPAYIWKKNGSTIGTNSANFTSSSLQNNDVITVEMTSSESCASPTSATSSGITMIVNPLLTPAVSISSTDTTICAGSSVTFTASPVNGGSTPTYVWKKNGSTVGTNSANFTSSSLQNNDVITVEMTSSETCASPTSATSSGITMIVNPLLTPAVSISSTDTTICAGSSVTFTANPVNGGNSPAYVWKKNGSSVGTNSANFTSSSLQNNDVITVEMTSSESCASPTSATSSGITMIVNPLLTPTVSISSTDTTICAGTSVTFTANPVNGGSTPTYVWKKNGSTVGTNSANFTSSSLQNNDVITVEMTSSEICASPTSATSSGITMIVNPLLTPTVSISSTDTTICAGTSVTFTANPVNGGSNPTYVWKKNGSTVGTNSANFTSSSLQNNDVITVEMTSSEICASPTSATSSGITMIVNPLLTPAVSINASNTTICAGMTVNFSANPDYPGLNPVYEWKLNGNIVGGNSPNYSNSSLQNGDFISLKMISSETCVTSSVANATDVTISVSSTFTPSVSISASDTISCSGSNVVFTAHPVNGGSSPTYQWKVNGNNISGNSPTYSSDSLQTNDVVSVVMTSSGSCASPSSATSSGITVTVNPLITPSVSISSTDTTICAGSSVTFTASPTNGGSSPSYVWKKNGNIVGTNSPSFTSSSLQNNDEITLEMTSSETCASPISAISSGITMIVNPLLTPAVSISSTDTTICAGSSVTFTASPTNGGNSPAYVWKKNGSTIGTNSANFTSSSLQNNDVITVEMTSSETCASPISAISSGITMIVNPLLTPAVSISSTDTTICTGTSVTFTANPVNGGGSPIYQWKLNGNDVGTNSANYTNSSLQQNDSIWVIMHSSEACANPDSAVAQTIHMNIVSSVIPAVSISATDTTICAGTSVTFTANPVNGGGSPIYQWKLNGNDVGTNSANYTNSSLQQNDSIWVIMHSSEACANPDSAVAQAIVMNIVSSLIPAVSISATDTTICAGTSVTFTANPVNGGGSPIYQWKLNGNDVGTNSANYTNSSLQQNDSIWVIMHSSEACANPDSAVAQAIVMNIVSSLIPSVSISATDTTICTGTSVTFTANPVNGGGSPIYQWKLNGNDVGTNSANYTNSSLQQNDSIWVIMHSSEACANPDSAVAQAIHMNIVSSLIPSVSISATDTTICTGTSVTFTANPVNGGGSPIYQWKLNGNDVGTNSANYTNSSLQQNDSIWVIMHSSEACANPDSAVAQAIHMNIVSSLIPSVSISATDTTICAGTSVTFTANPVNGGGSPIYQWKLNGNDVGTNSANYTNSSLQQNDSIWVIMHSSEACANPDSAVAQAIHMNIVSSLIPAVSISATDTTICAGTSVTFTANPVNGGGSPIYQWKLNGNDVGINSANYTNNSLADGDSVFVIMYSSEACASPDSAIAQAIYINVIPLPSTPSIILLGIDTLSSSVTANSYLWYRNSTLLSISTKSFKVTQNGNYQLIIEENGCLSDASAVYAFNSVSIKDLSDDSNVKLYPNPAYDKVYIDFGNIDEKISYYVYSESSALVYKAENQRVINKISIDINNLNQGVYYVKIVTQDKLIMKPFIIQR